jgi:carbonic anhydrase
MKRNLSLCFGVLLACILLPSALSAAEGGHWGYSGEFDPANWHKADPAFRQCGEGRNQTPVNLEPRYDVELPPLRLNYARQGESVLNNGHTIQVTFPDGNSLSVGGDRNFALQQVHFHSPGENMLRGRPFLLEAHFVHGDKEGNLLVLAVFFREGEENPGLASLWEHMPQEANRTARLPRGAFDPLSILPVSLDYIYINGSLTTPPCSEGVRWCVLKTPLTASREQAEALVRVMRGPNNRPLQAVNARQVLE